MQTPLATPIPEASAVDSGLRGRLLEILERTEVEDIHSHLYAPEFGDLLLSGIDELLEYHYLVAEFFRAAHGEIRPDAFWQLRQVERSELVWKYLFSDRHPVSEAALGVVRCLEQLGLDPTERDLGKLRSWFAQRSVTDRVEAVLSRARVGKVVMTNDPFDELERPVWEEHRAFDGRFVAALRIDRLLQFDREAICHLRAQGYDVVPELSTASKAEVQRFLRDWVARMKPVYMAASLPPEFSERMPLLRECVLPVAKEHDLPVALMIGVRRQVNPELQLAGDGVGRANLAPLAQLCSDNPRVRFLCTVLGREDQHELVVLGRKFPNLHIFGCWWFVNIRSLTHEITRMRLELLGHTFTPQHSDARVLEQLLYKWDDARQMLATVLAERYGMLAERGAELTNAQLEREIAGFLGGNARGFLAAR